MTSTRSCALLLLLLPPPLLLADSRQQLQLACMLLLQPSYIAIHPQLRTRVRAAHCCIFTDH
jgi:hypothetical protein